MLLLKVQEVQSKSEQESRKLSESIPVLQFWDTFKEAAHLPDETGKLLQEWDILQLRHLLKEDREV